VQKTNFKKYKAIVCGFDGTLVGRQLKIPFPVQNAIKSLSKYKIYFSIASGRSFVGPIEEACRILNLKTPQITRGGAEIINPVNKKVLHQELIPNKEINKLQEFLKKNQIFYYIEKGNFIYTKNGEEMKGIRNISIKKLDHLELSNIPKVGIQNIGNFKDEIHFEESIKNVLRSSHYKIKYPSWEKLGCDGGSCK